MSDSTEKKMVGDLEVNELLSLILQALDARDEKSEGVDPKLVHLTVKDFTERVLQYTKSSTYAVAQKERLIAERIIQDWEGLKNSAAVTMPCRIKSKEEALNFGKNMAETFGPGFRGELSVVVAVVQPDGSYTARTPPEL